MFLYGCTLLLAMVEQYRFHVFKRQGRKSVVVRLSDLEVKAVYTPLIEDENTEYFGNVPITDEDQIREFKRTARSYQHIIDMAVSGNYPNIDDLIDVCNLNNLRLDVYSSGTQTMNIEGHPNTVFQTLRSYVENPLSKRIVYLEDFFGK